MRPRLASMDILSAEDLCQGSVDFLLEVWSPELGLFPYSTSRPRRRVRQRLPSCPRPTDTRSTPCSGCRKPRAPDFWTRAKLSSLAERFLEREFRRLASIADLGLLLVLLREGQDSVTAPRRSSRLVRVATAGRGRSSTSRPSAGCFWGLSAAAASSAEAETGRPRGVQDDFDELCRRGVGPGAT